MEPSFKSAEYNSGWKRIKNITDENRVETELNVKFNNLKDEITKVKEDFSKENQNINELRALINNIIKKQSDLEVKLLSIEKGIEEKLEKIQKKDGQFDINDEIKKVIEELQKQDNTDILQMKNQIENMKKSFEEYKQLVNNQIFLISEVLQNMKDASEKQVDKGRFLSNIFKKSQ